MLVQERVYTAEEYRFGFQGQEKDDEVKGGGSTLSFKCRIYDSRTGKFLSVDPLASSFAWNSTYAFANMYSAGALPVYGPSLSLGTAITPYVQNGLPSITTSSVAPIQGIKVTGHAWGFETALNADTKLKYTGSHRKMAYNDQADYDGTPVNVFAGIRNTDYTAVFASALFRFIHAQST